MKNLFLSCLLLVCSTGWAAELIGPTQPIPPLWSTEIRIDGLTIEQLKSAKVECDLPEGIKPEQINLKARFDLQMRPLIDFAAMHGGKYKITLSLGEWIPTVDPRAKASADRALLALDPRLRADIRNLEEEMLLHSISCLVEVSGNPPEPPKPPVTEGKRTIAILQETEDTDQALASMLTMLRDDPKYTQYLTSKQHQLLILDWQDKDANDQPSSVIARLRQAIQAKTGTPATGQLLVILDPARPLAECVISVDKLPVPASYQPIAVRAAADSILDAIKKAGG